MIVSINQPAYLPWLGYFDRIAASDVHVVLDHVQFEKNSFVNRNRVRTPQGSTWLTVPVETSGKFGQLAIDRLQIASDQPWARKHWKTIDQCYARAPYFHAHRDHLAEIYSRPWKKFYDLVDEITGYLLRAFAIDVPLVRSSSMRSDKTKSDLVLDICRRLDARLYLSGPLGRGYLDEGSFAAAGIEIVYQDYRHPVYPQLSPGFKAFMAAIDILFMLGPESGQMLRTTQRPLPSSEIAR